MPDYEHGYDDGVERVLEMIESFINHSIIVGMDRDYIGPLEDCLEDIRNTLDEQTP